MADSISRTVTKPEEINGAVNWADTNTVKALAGGPVLWTLSRPELKRDDHDNRKFHAIMGDVISQATIKSPGVKVKLSDYGPKKGKALLVTWFAKEKEQMGEPLRYPGEVFQDPLSGEMLTVRPSTTDFLKGESRDFCQFLWALGAECGVQWSEPALKEYENYREATK